MIPSLVDTPSIIIVDDHALFRQGLTAILTSENIARVIAEPQNGKEFLEVLPCLKPDLVLMDIDMPEMTGIEATEKALALVHDLKIIVFTMFDDEDYYYKMIDLGVRGYLLKSSGFNELETAIKIVMSGEYYFSNAILKRVIVNYGTNNTSDNSDVCFTKRELCVLRLIGNGLTSEEIGKKLNISTVAVKKHRSALLKKAGCKNTPGLILYAIMNQLIEL